MRVVGAIWPVVRLHNSEYMNKPICSFNVILSIRLLFHMNAEIIRHST